MEIDIPNCSIIHYPSKVLMCKAKPVAQIDQQIRRLVERMAEVMIGLKGIGLAAPQVGVPLRLFIVSLDCTREHMKVFVNPTIQCFGPLQSQEEGCLSVPGIYTHIPRYASCEVTATDLEGRQFTERAEGLYARCLQHEFDHIEGITIVQRMGCAGRIAHRRQLKRLEGQADQ
ncbi:MAG: peptide deformylase [Sedimentisphaerales bacterium]|nr:peptide deformylase [Sedimentisphaerales bacterium]